ncbi:hypothetical protein [Streptomyces hyaluromycini]|uniref:hypothetical protein n=1 Tax=Streptomyces hyaluromycini TaxID=1377993 RepID=UPI000B5CCE48|nr:hypothetical protein [Streptomyces hyaluromycini]
MPTDESKAVSRPASAPSSGALLLCRAAPDAVTPLAALLRQRMLLTEAGEWSLLVPEGTPWLRAGEPVDRVLTGWATALAVGSAWPVLGLWWDADRAGFTLAAGFRRPVGYAWLADGTPAGETGAMHTFAARLGLDSVLDMQYLDRLATPDPAADAGARLRGLTAVLTRAGLELPEELAPGEPAERLCELAGAGAHVRHVEGVGAGRAEGGMPRAHRLALAEVVVGLPAAAWGMRRRSVGWAAVGAVLMVHGALELSYETVFPRD